jgi:ABC-type multidrug transport system ATPase subunit
MTLFVTTHYMDEAERCSHVGYIYMSKLITCGQPEDLKLLPEVNPAGTRRIEIVCDHVTMALKAVRSVTGIRSATVFGQSMNVLVDVAVSDDAIRAQLKKENIHTVDIRPIAPSLEDVFVTLTEANR